MTHLTRRQFLAAGAAFLYPGTALSAPNRMAAIDWGLLETCLALGAPPLAATELRQFRQIAIEPDVPESVIDLGLRGSPNIELLRMLMPDTILISGFYDYMRSGLERIAPVLKLPVYEPGKAPYALAQFSTRVLGRHLGRMDEADRYIRLAGDILSAWRGHLAGLAAHPVFVISLGDARHFRAFGADSIFGEVIARLGLRNAWTETTSYSAAAPVGLEHLARVPDASIAVVGPLPPEVRRRLDDNAIWNALPAVKERRVAILEPINHFGALPSALRFATLLAKGFSDA